MSEWVKIIHPGTQGVAEVNRSSLYQWYQSGWRLLASDEEQALTPEPPPEPEPITADQAAQAATDEPGEM